MEQFRTYTHPFRMQVTVIQIRNEFGYLVSPHEFFQFHRSPPIGLKARF